MMLFESLLALFAPDIIGDASRALGERASAVQRGLTGALAVVFCEVTRSAETDQDDAFTQFAQQHAAAPGLLEHLDVIFAAGDVAPGIAHSARQATSELFGQRAGKITAALAAVAGMKVSSAIALLAVTTLITLGFLSHYQMCHRLSVADLASQLRAQQNSWVCALPAGLTQDF
jgi:hypothetical protein